ncbi:MAG: WecB/TagA/CpsF family glycosyltransferase [Dongiaceae bacterium]
MSDMSRPPREAGRQAPLRRRATTAILGIPISRHPLEEILRDAIASIDGRAPRRVVACANPHSLVLAQQDAEFRAALLHATYLLPDGVGVVKASKLSAAPIARRIAGGDFFDGLMRALDRRSGARVFFLGSTPATLQKIAAHMATDYPNLALCGTLSPPFGDWPNAVDLDLVEAINRARPDLLWVGMTAPRQERWVERNRDRLDVPVIGSIGAVFDFFAGTTPRAPAWAQQAGIEWLHRLVKQPRRMWRRTFLSAPQFLELVLREKLSRTVSRPDESRPRP